MKLESSLTCVALASLVISCSGSTQIGESGGNEGGSAGSVNSGGVGGSSGGSVGNGTTSTDGTTDTGGASNSGGGASSSGDASNSDGTANSGGTTSTTSTANTASTAAGGSGGFGQCQEARDCPQASSPCEQCADGTLACPYIDCIAGECVGSFPTCETTCTEDADCPVSLGPCQVCADGTSACPWARCEDGSCKNGTDVCGDEDPCGGKQCGDLCSACDPDSAVCNTVLMYCNEELECQSNQPLCNAFPCENDSQCPVAGACPLCADGTSCAELKCVNGSCQFDCLEEDGCSGDGDSCAGGATCCSGLTCCAGVPVPEGEEYCSANDCPDSDVNLKRDFGSVDSNVILERLAALPIATWSYRAEPSAKHIGPMAQDFMASFNVGASDRAIAKVDADGVAFAAIQALYGRLQALEVRNAKLERELSNASDCACSRDHTP